MNSYNYDVFISRKEEDKEFAKILYDFLTANGLKVFESRHSLQQIGNSDYRKAIDEVLPNVKHMIVLSSSKQYITASWVEAEWGFYINRKRSNSTYYGNILTLLVGNLKIEDLPPSLRNYTAIRFDEFNFNEVLCYLNKDQLQKSESEKPFESLNNMGNQHFDKKEYTEALKFYEQASEMGDPASQLNLGYMYFYGLGVYQNTNAAIFWYSESARNGNTQAMNNLGIIYEFGQGGITKDQKIAYNNYYNAAKEGDSSAQFRIGLYNFDGVYFLENYSEAFYWFDNSAEYNDSSKNYLGVLYEKNLVKSNNNPYNAFICYEAAAKNNHFLGIINLARCYYYGIGVSVNYFSALNYYSKAAKLGHVDSALIAANLYYDGDKVVQNYKEAAYYFAVAADFGSVEGLYRLGLIYLKGTGVDPDRSFAIKALSEASKKGSYAAKKLILNI
ncbi:MAG: TIR domain-containing protein [Cytophagales bacterium]|nr:TIR domain-containing protein [Cytophagales bacterium]